VTPSILGIQATQNKEKGVLLNRVDNLRRRANRYRELAAIPTNGGHRANLLLLKLADDLERQADELENQSEEPEPVYSGT
jgi:hypothetical protein